MDMNTVASKGPTERFSDAAYAVYLLDPTLTDAESNIPGRMVALGHLRAFIH